MIALLGKGSDLNLHSLPLIEDPSEYQERVLSDVAQDHFDSLIDPDL